MPMGVTEAIKTGITDDRRGQASLAAWPSEKHLVRRWKQCGRKQLNGYTGAGRRLWQKTEAEPVRL